MGARAQAQYKPKNRKNEKKRERFVGIPRHVAMSDPFKRLSAPCLKLLVDILTQYNGSNNGLLSPCHTLMKERGWAKSSLYRAFRDLEYAGFVVVTRQGRKVRGYATFIAITWNGIDDQSKVEYDEGVVCSDTPLNYWCKVQKNWKLKPTMKPKAKSK